MQITQFICKIRVAINVLCKSQKKKGKEIIKKLFLNNFNALLGKSLDPLSEPFAYGVCVSVCVCVGNFKYTQTQHKERPRNASHTRTHTHIRDTHTNKAQEVS